MKATRAADRWLWVARRYMTDQAYRDPLAEAKRVAQERKASWLGLGYLEIALERLAELVECPACAGQGQIYPGATVGMWAGLLAFDAKPEPCELCNGEGEITPDLAAEWENRQLEALLGKPHDTREIS